MTSTTKSLNSPVESTLQPGQELDPVEQALVRNGLPRTRRNWLRMAYMGDPPKPWTRELENELPPDLQRDVVPGNNGPELD
jgi:hypothetical protein